MTVQYDSRNVTDWVTPLTKIYNTQSQQLNLFLQQQKEVDRQKQEAAITIPEVLGQGARLAKFSKTLQKQAAAREARKTQDFSTSYSTIFSIDQQTKIAQLTSELDLQKDSVNLFKELEKSLTLSEEQKAFLKSNSGGNLLRLRKILAWEQVKSGHVKFAQEIENTPYLEEKYDEHKRNGTVAAFYQQYQLNGLKRLGFNDKFISSHFLDEISRAGNTKGVLSSLQYKQVTLSQEEDLLKTELKDLVFESSENLGTRAATLLSSYKEKFIALDQEKGSAKFVNSIYRLAKSGDLPDYTIDLMRSGELKDFAGGDTGEKLLSPEDWTYIEQGVTEYNTQVTTEFKAGIENTILDTKATIIEGDLPVQELQKLKNDTLLYIQRTLGIHSKEYKDLDTMDVTLNNKDSYKEARDKYSMYFNGNNLGSILEKEEDFKTEPNVKVRRELADLVKEAKQTLRDANLPDTWSKYLTHVGDTILTSPAQKKALTREKVFSENTKLLRAELARKQLEFLIQAKKDGNSLDVGKKLYKDWLDDEGFNVNDRDKNAGRLSPNYEGEYVNYGFRREADVENKTKPSNARVNYWIARADKKVKLAGGNVDDALKEAEAIIDKEDVLGAFIHNSGNLYYSPEVITKALTMAIQPGTLLLKSLDALIQNPDYNAYVQRFKLKEKRKLLVNPPDIQLAEKIKDITNEEEYKKFISQYNHHGIRSFSFKQLEKLKKLEQDHLIKKKNDG